MIRERRSFSASKCSNPHPYVSAAPSLLLIINNPSESLWDAAKGTERSNMSEQRRIYEMSGSEQLIADLKIPSGNAFGVPQTRQYSSGTYSARLNNRPTAVHVYAERRF